MLIFFQSPPLRHKVVGFWLTVDEAFVAIEKGTPYLVSRRSFRVLAMFG
jgi:hypothetical protein